jgi:dephospho-CoA kinase
MTPNAPPRAPLVCLTGGIASGKSRVAGWFAGRGWEVVCADEIVHGMYRPGHAVAASVGKEFGPGVLAADGSVDRSRLGELVFADPAKRARLEALVHPAVREAWKARAGGAAASGRAAMVVIPLAYEVGASSEFERVWVVACSARTQEARLADRGLGRAAAAKRLGAQLPLQAKVDRADRVIWNDGPWERTVEQAERLERECARGLTLS